MNKNNSSANKYFILALQKHRENKLKDAQNLYNKSLDLFPNHANTHNNLGIIYFQLGDYNNAIDCYEKAIKINPNYSEAYNNLGVIFKNLGSYQNAIDCYEKAIKINPNYSEAYNNLGSSFNNLREFNKAMEYYEKAIKINPNYSEAYNNLGVLFQRLQDYEKAIDIFEKLIEFNPNHSIALINLGSIFYELGKYHKSKNCYEKAIKVNPKCTEAYWNLQAFAENIDEALSIINKILINDSKNIKAQIMLGSLQAYKENSQKIENYLPSKLLNHHHVRSIKWIFSLPKLPKIFFNRCYFYDYVIELSEKLRPFYEFGVWRGVSFQYLISKIKKGFGFDTFTGLPEAWNKMPKGSYSSFGLVPKINGGEFVVGKFEDTLPKFFSKQRPMASIINLDADLYSSTLCALNNSKKIIDEKTILIFDELIMGETWEEDEYKALNEFCNNFGFAYDILAFSFFTGQVAIRIKKV